MGPATFIDLMWPNVTETGFASAEEARPDRLYHPSRVREMIEQMQVFVFTLGLTETWIEPAADIVYGSHPAVFVNAINASVATALNPDYGEVVNDLNYVLDLIARHNRNPPGPGRSLRSAGWRAGLRPIRTATF